jgi:hypothetical protein
MVRDVYANSLNSTTPQLQKNSVLDVSSQNGNVFANAFISPDSPVTTLSTIPEPIRRKSRVYGQNCALYAKSVTGIVTNAPVARLTLAYAEKAGYETTKDKPVVGAIGQTKEGAVGHVFVVEKVVDNRVLTSERNFPVKSRWVDINDPIVQGFILPKE